MIVRSHIEILMSYLQNDKREVLSLGRLKPSMLALIALSLSLLIAASWPRPVFLINHSPSVELGLYWLSKTLPAHLEGKIVAFKLPEPIRQLALARQYVNEDTLILKPVLATAGEICQMANGLFHNGQWLASVPTTDSQGRPLPMRQGCWSLQADEAFVFSDRITHSFDSRYFGQLKRNELLGRATLIIGWDR